MISTLLVIFFTVLFIGIPIYMSLTMGVLGTTLLFGDIPPAIVPLRMFGGMNNFTLMSIPFFILAAELMRIGGLAVRLINLAKVLVGWIPGGLAATAVIACLFFGSISGSSPATVAAIGSIMFPVLVSNGYSKKFAIGLLTSAGVLGPIIPPSIGLIVYGAVTGTSIGKLFAGGILPGFIFASMLVLYCYIYAKKTKQKSASFPTMAEFIAALKQTAWGFGLPVLLLGGIYTGIFTPTESAAVACIYGFIVGAFVYRQIKLKEILDILKSTGLMSATLLIITGGASAFSWLIASSGAPIELAKQVIGFTDSPVVLLILFNIVLLIAGCFLDGASAIIVLAPLMTPIAVQYGIDPVHFGLIVLLNTSVGMITPPVGLNLFVACAISKMNIQSVFVAAVPTMLILIVCLLLITYIPWISLVIPNLLY
jgi:C4-dicarboxylate transporter DctM subunit